MCDPVSIGLAVSAAGAGLSARESNKNQKRITNARNDAFQANRERQNGFIDESQQAFNTNVEKQGAENFQEQQGVQEERFKEAFGAVQNQGDYTAGNKSSAPKNLIIAQNDAKEEAAATTQRDVDGLSKLFGYSGAGFNQGLDRNEFSRAFGNISNEATADNNLLGIELEAASNNANKAPSLFPQLLQLGGQASSLFGASGGAFSQTTEGALPASGIGPGAPSTQYGIFPSGGIR